MVMSHTDPISGVVRTLKDGGRVSPGGGPPKANEAKGDGTVGIKRDDLDLMKACRQFEGIFLSMLFRAMMKTTGAKDQGPYGTIAEQAFGQKMAEAGGIGLAKVLFNSLAKSSPEIQRRR